MSSQQLQYSTMPLSKQSLNNPGPADQGYDRQSEPESMNNAAAGNDKTLSKFEKSLFALISGYVFILFSTPG